MPKSVDSQKISVVIQGPLYRNLSPERNIFTCIASIRKHLPQAEIIVSTWRHEDISAVAADQFIVSDDPGCFFDEAGNQINMNRMLRSTLAGIEAAGRPYVMKLRADHNLTSSALAVIDESKHAVSSEAMLFETPITLTTLYIRNPQRAPLLFHISDLVQFGTREAMLALWKQPLFKRDEVFNSKPSRNPFGNFCGYSSARMVAEQCIMLGAMRMQGIDVSLAHPCQTRISDVKLWDSILRCNFRVLDYAEAGVDFPERFLQSDFLVKTLYTAAEIERLHHVAPKHYKLRMAGIWFNQYLLSCLRPAWWISLVSIALFSTSPSLAKSLRSYWRRVRRVEHADSYRT